MKLAVKELTKVKPKYLDLSPLVKSALGVLTGVTLMTEFMCSYRQTRDTARYERSSSPKYVN